MDQEIFLDILTGYVMGPQAFRLLRQYLDRLVMVAIASVYHGDPFNGYRGVTQGYSISPTTSNVVVDTVLRHWVTEVARE